MMKTVRPCGLSALLIALMALFAAPVFADDVNAGPAAPVYAQSLDFYACDHVVRVDITNAWEGAPPLSYALVPQRSPDPDAADFNSVITVPVQRIVSFATPVLAHLSDLSASNRVVGVDQGSYIYNEAVRTRLAGGQIVELGSGADVDIETLIALRPDVVILSVYGPDDPTLARISAAGIPAIVYSDWREQNALGRAEWIRLVGLLVGRDRQAERLFDQRASSYTELRATVENSLTPRTARPRIMANAPWQGSWPIPGGDSYMARLFADAGGDYIWSDSPGTGSRFLDLEAVLSQAANADLWINGNFDWNTLSDVTNLDPRLAAFGPYQAGEMYHHNGRVRQSGANDFWESGAARPDLLLADLVRIIHPQILPQHQPVYYTRLAP